MAIVDDERRRITGVTAMRPSGLAFCRLAGRHVGSLRSSSALAARLGSTGPSSSLALLPDGVASRSSRYALRYRGSPSRSSSTIGPRCSSRRLGADTRGARNATRCSSSATC